MNTILRHGLSIQDPAALTQATAEGISIGSFLACTVDEVVRCFELGTALLPLLPAIYIGEGSVSPFPLPYMNCISSGDGTDRFDRVAPPSGLAHSFVALAILHNAATAPADINRLLTTMLSEHGPAFVGLLRPTQRSAEGTGAGTPTSQHSEDTAEAMVRTFDDVPDKSFEREAFAFVQRSQLANHRIEKIVGVRRWFANQHPPHSPHRELPT